MELTTDELLESIGSFGRYQIMLNVFCKPGLYVLVGYTCDGHGVYCIGSRLEMQK